MSARHPVSSSEPKRKLIERPLLILPPVLAAALMIPMLGRASLWRDEAATWYVSTLSPIDLVKYVAHRDAVFAAYDSFMHFWLLVSQSAFWMRLPGVLAGIVTVVAVQWLGARLWRSAFSGFLAALLLAIHPSFLAWCMQARSYAFAVCFTALAACALVSAVNRESKWGWWRYALIAVLALYSHLFAGWAIVAQVSALVICRRLSRAAIPALLTAAVATAPLILTLRQRGQVDWITPLNVTALVNEARFLLPALVWIVFALAAVLLVGDVRGDADERFAAVLVLTWAVLPPLALTAVSLVHPILVQRYTLVAVPGIVLVLAGGLRRLRPRGVVVASAVTAGVLFTYAAQSVLTSYRVDNYRAAAEYISGLGKPPLLGPRNRLLGIAYYQRTDSGARSRRVALDQARWRDLVVVLNPSHRDVCDGLFVGLSSDSQQEAVHAVQSRGCRETSRRDFGEVAVARLTSGASR